MGGDPSTSESAAAPGSASNPRNLATNADGCIEIRATGRFRFSATANSGWFTAAYGSGIEPELADGWQGLSIKLRERDGFRAAPGTFDLSEEPPDTSECHHCVYVSYRGSGDNFQLDIATAGTLTIESVDTDTGELVATLEDVTFRHLNQVALHSFETFAEDGHCVYLERGEVDTTATPGEPCQEAADCQNAKLLVCDPGSAECVPVGCTTDDPSCDDGGACQIQNPFYEVGACYTRCEPFTGGACSDGLDCLPVDYVGAEGVCLRPSEDPPEPRTETKAGRSCEPEQIGTGCGPGHVCTTHAIYWHYDHCYRVCDYFAENPGCSAGHCWLKLHTQKEIDTTYLCGRGDCHFGGFCRETDDESLFGDLCGAGKEKGAPCRGDGSRSGVCIPDAGGAMVCRRHCRTEADDCDAGQTCRQMIVDEGEPGERAIAGLGYCE